MDAQILKTKTDGTFYVTIDVDGESKDIPVIAEPGKVISITDIPYIPTVVATASLDCGQTNDENNIDSVIEQLPEGTEVVITVGETEIGRGNVPDGGFGGGGVTAEFVAGLVTENGFTANHVGGPVVEFTSPLGNSWNGLPVVVTANGQVWNGSDFADGV